MTLIGPADVHLPAVGEDNSTSLELCLSLTCDHISLCLDCLPDPPMCRIWHTWTCPGGAHAHRDLRDQQCGTDQWACFWHPPSSRPLGSVSSSFKPSTSDRLRPCVSGHSPGQSQPHWRRLRQDPAMPGAGSQPGLQPRASLMCKNVHAKTLLLLEKKFLKARGLPCHEVQSGEAAGCASCLLRDSKARFACCPCCRVTGHPSAEGHYCA